MLNKVICINSMGPDVVPCDFCAIIDFLLNSIDKGVLCTEIMGFKFSKPKSPIWASIFKN